MDDDDDDLNVTTPSARFRALDLVIVLVDTVGGLFGTIESLFDDVTRMLCMHANWKRDRAKVAQEMHESIERIVKE